MWLVLLLYIAAHAPTPRPEVRVTPRFANAPAAVRVTARTGSGHVGWCLSLTDSEASFERTSCEDTAGPETVSQVYEGLPPGHYTVTFGVLYEDRSRRFATTDFCVYGGEISC